MCSKFVFFIIIIKTIMKVTNTAILYSYIYLNDNINFKHTFMKNVTINKIPIQLDLLKNIISGMKMYVQNLQTTLLSENLVVLREKKQNAEEVSRKLQLNTGPLSLHGNASPPEVIILNLLTKFCLVPI